MQTHTQGDLSITPRRLHHLRYLGNAVLDWIMYTMRILTFVAIAFSTPFLVNAQPSGKTQDEDSRDDRRLIQMLQSLQKQSLFANSAASRSALLRYLRILRTLLRIHLPLRQRPIPVYSTLLSAHRRLKGLRMRSPMCHPRAAHLQSLLPL